MTKWDKLLFLFNLPFLVFLFGPVQQLPTYEKVLIASIIAIVGITATTIASHTLRTSYTPWAQRVWGVPPLPGKNNFEKKNLFSELNFLKKIQIIKYMMNFIMSGYDL